MRKLLFTLAAMLAFTTFTTIAGAQFTVHLRDNVGVALADGGSAVLKYYDSGWKTATSLGNGDFQIVTPQSTLNLKMYYAGGAQQVNNVSTGAPYTFNTTLVIVTLNESDGSTAIPGATVKYYASGWKTFGVTNGAGNATKQLLPIKYHFKMYYGGASQQQSNVDVGVTPTVAYQTAPAVVKLVSSTSASISGASVKYYASGWKTFGTTDGTGCATKELLPVKYHFKMYYEGASQQQSNVMVNTTPAATCGSPTATFQTTLVTVSLLESDATTAIPGATVKYYASGWKTFGVTDGSGNATKELLPVKYHFKMYYAGASQQKSNIDVNTTPSATYLTAPAVVKLLSSTNTPISGGVVKYYASGWKAFGTTDGTGCVTKELLPVKYHFKMYYMGASQQKSNITVTSTPAASCASPTVTYNTTLVKVELVNCTPTGIQAGTVKYYASGWKSFGTTDMNGEATKELLPVKYHFKMYLNGKSQQISNQDVAINPTATFTTVTVTLNYGAGTIKYYASGWKTFNQPTMEMLPGDYPFKFYTGGSLDFQQTLSLTGCTYGGNIFAFRTIKADGSALPDIPISRNDYGNHYVPVGTTDANGFLFTTTMPSGSWKYRANKNYSNQYITSGAGLLTFQTAKYTAHVKHTDGSDFAGVETEYNDYGNHWIDLDPKYTDANGNASIELFAGTYNFRAKKNYSVQTKSLSLANPGDAGTVEFQTSTFTAHVKKHDGSDFAGIETEYNDYGNHWIDLSPQYTDASGNASIELFPGDFNFRAKKNYSVQVETLEITTSGNTDVVEFQTALAIGLVKDCDLDAPVAGIQVEYNDYGNHWIDLAPSSTGADGKASIELFPGTFDLRAKNIYTSEEKPIVLTRPTTTVEFNPTRVNFNYAGTVKYNDYGNHWYTMSGDEYMFTGTYDFRFDGDDQTLTIAGCAVEGVAFIHGEFSDASPMAGKDVEYYYWPGPTVLAGQTDANGDLTILLPDDKSTVDFWLEHYGYKQKKTQNIHSDPYVNYTTVEVTLKMQDHDGDGSTDDLTGNQCDNLEIYKWPTTKTFGSGVTSGYEESMELLPMTYDFTMRYEGVKKTVNQDVGTNATVVFQTVLKTLYLKDHTGGTALLTADGVDITYYKWPYTGTFGDGELNSTDGYTESMDLFDVGDYKYTVKYVGVEKSIETSNNTQTFATKNYTLSLVDHTGGTGNLSGDAYNATYYKWPYTGTFGDGTLASSDGYVESMELFDHSYDFTISYESHSQKKTSSGNTVFQTGKVVDADGSCNQYYKWPSSDGFVNGMELLPNAYEFRFTNPGQPDVTCTVVAGQILTVPGCTYSSLGPALTVKQEGDPMNADPNVSKTDYANETGPIFNESKQSETVDIKVYPNPTSFELYIETTETCQIFNANGQMMYQFVPGQMRSVDVSNWAPGFYVVRSESGKVKRFVKQ